MHGGGVDRMDTSKLQVQVRYRTTLWMEVFVPGYFYARITLSTTILLSHTNQSAINKQRRKVCSSLIWLALKN